MESTKQSSAERANTELIKRLQIEGNALISRALDLDEQLSSSNAAATERTLRAKGLYEQGAAKCKQALSIRAEGSEAREAQTKLNSTLKRVLERIKVLGQSNRSSSTQPRQVPTVKGVDSVLVRRLMDEVIEPAADADAASAAVVVGHERAKQILQESIFLPLQRPDLFTGIRAASRGVLLFGPPGTGKTMLARWVVKACSASGHSITFFNLSAATLLSKWVGESEKLVKALFSTAKALQPAVIFIDEIDSLLMTREASDKGESDAMRRVKTEFLLQFDGLGTSAADRIVLIGATNRPYDLDEAARRRFTKRILIGLPELKARRQLLEQLLHTVPCALKSRDLDKIAGSTDGYSAADIASLAGEIAMGPVREVSVSDLLDKKTMCVRAINWADAEAALKQTRSSIDPRSVQACAEWNNKFGS